MSSNTTKVTIQRGSDSDGNKVHSDIFEVPAHKSQRVLDVVSWVQQNADPTLSYRFACRVGMCGSCAMMVNGVPRWTCRSLFGLLIYYIACQVCCLCCFCLCTSGYCLPWTPQQKTLAAGATAVSFIIAGLFFLRAL